MDADRLWLPAQLTLERADEEDDPIRFTAIVARRDKVDASGILLQPSALGGDDKQPAPLMRQHNRSGDTLGWGRMRITRKHATFVGQLHPTQRAAEFAVEAASLAEGGLGEASVGITFKRNDVRFDNELTRQERNLGAKAVIDHAAVQEVSFVDRGSLAGSRFSLGRAGITYIDTIDHQDTIALLREMAPVTEELEQIAESESKALLPEVEQALERARAVLARGKES